MPWMPDYSNPIFGVEDRAQVYEGLMKHAPWARRRWLHESERYRQVRFFYRYQDFDPGIPLSMTKATDLIVESRLYVPSPRTFNDPYEFQARVRLAENPVDRRRYWARVAEREGKKRGLKPKHRRQGLSNFMRNTHSNPAVMAEITQQQRDRWGIACFSLNPRGLRMWSHYAAGHTGICLQFDPSEDLAIAAQTLAVNYQPEMAALRWPEDQNRVLEDVLLRKWDIWKEEEEVRYATQRVIDAHLPLSPSFLKGIILGNRFPLDSVSVLNDLLKRRKARGFPGLKLFKADRFSDRYGMFVRRLTSAERAMFPDA